MSGLRSVWEQEHGKGSVIGLAPSAAAAEVLAAELGIGTENTAKWLTEWRASPSSQPAETASPPTWHVTRIRTRQMATGCVLVSMRPSKPSPSVGSGPASWS
jgi:hypothetical protein